MVAQVRYSVAGRLRGRVAPCAVCTWHVETRSASFLVEPQKHGRRFCEWFGLKTTRTVSTGLASKPVVTVFAGLTSKPVATIFTGLASKPVAMVFASLASKLVATVSPSLFSKLVIGFLVESQNQGGRGFFCLGLKTGSSGLVI
jgi:hypothetical protein